MPSPSQVLLSIDEGISGYRDDSLEAVKRNREQYGMELKVRQRERERRERERERRERERERERGERERERERERHRDHFDFPKCVVHLYGGFFCYARVRPEL